MSIALSNLIWIDLEMTGLNTLTDQIIEVALIITDSNLNTIAEGPVIAIHQSDAMLDNMDAWNKKYHGQSGLITRVQESLVSEAEAEQRCLTFLQEHVPANTSPMCGNSICQDRRFLAANMPLFEDYFHYQNLDVSSLKILAQRWAPDIAKGLRKVTTHVALQDIKDSIEELKYYRKHLFNTDAMIDIPPYVD